MRVLIVIDQFYAGYGGSEQHILFLLDELPRHGVDVRFAVMSGIRQASPRSFPVPPVVLADGSRSRVLRPMRLIKRLAGLINDVKPDVIHAFCPISEIASLFAVRLTGSSKVLGVRRNTGYWHTRWTLSRARFAHLFGAHYVANCEAAKRFAVNAERVSPHRVTVIPNPVVTRRLTEGIENIWPRERLGIADGELTVGIVATIRPVKDHATFLRAARLLLDNLPNTRFLLVGSHDSETLEQVRSLAARLAVEKQVSWVGVVPNPYCVLPRFDVAVLSSRSEAMSNALLEYSAAGVATVATDVGAAREIVEDNRTGFLVPPGRPDLMAERICRLLGNGGLRRQFGERARQRAHSLFSEDTVLDQYLKLYTRLAGRQD